MKPEIFILNEAGEAMGSADISEVRWRMTSHTSGVRFITDDPIAVRVRSGLAVKFHIQGMPACGFSDKHPCGDGDTITLMAGALRLDFPDDRNAEA